MHHTHVSTTYMYVTRMKISTKISLCRCCTVAPDEIYEQYNILFIQGIFFALHKNSKCVLDKIHLRVTGKKLRKKKDFFVRLVERKTLQR